MDKQVLRERILLILILLLILFNCFIGWELFDIKRAMDNEEEYPQGETNDGYAELSEKIDNMQVDINYLQKNIGALSNAVLAEKVEEICEEKNSDEEKAIAVAQWICENISNREYDYLKNNVQYNSFGWFATRSGLCNSRANIFVDMMGFLNLNACIMNLYDFPSVQSGHSAVEVYYDGKWHFLDPTYGGYFRNQDGELMSLEEMHQNPEEAIAGMVVFEGTLDKTSNYERMSYNYTVETLGGLRSYAPMSRSETAVVYPTVDMGFNKTWQIGELDESDEDVKQGGMEMNLSSYLDFGLAVPYIEADVQTEWNFINCDVGKKYYLEYYYYSGKTGEFQAISDTARIIEGDTLNIEETDESGNGVWRIGFIPDSAECTIRIGHDYMEIRAGANIDRICIYSADNWEEIK